MNCAGQSGRTDTICFPVPVIQKVLVAAEQKKVLEQQLTIVGERVALLKSIIAEMEKKDSVSIDAYNAEINVMNDKIELYKDQMNGYEKLLRREKRKRFFTSMAGILTTAAATFFYITK